MLDISDAALEGTWVTSDGAAPSYTNWESDALTKDYQFGE